MISRSTAENNLYNLCFSNQGLTQRSIQFNLWKNASWQEIYKINYIKIITESEIENVKIKFWIVESFQKCSLYRKPRWSNFKVFNHFWRSCSSHVCQGLKFLPRLLNCYLYSLHQLWMLRKKMHIFQPSKISQKLDRKSFLSFFFIKLKMRNRFGTSY